MLSVAALILSLQTLSAAALEPLYPGEKSEVVPYNGPATPLAPGQFFSVRGKINADAQNFTINYGRDEILLHIDVRYVSGKTALSTYQRGKGWLPGAMVANAVQRGESFYIHVRALADKYEIRMNNKKFYDYPQILPTQGDEKIKVVGDCTVDGVHYGGKFYALPLNLKFKKGAFKTGQRVYIHGVPTKNGYFRVELAPNRERDDASDVFFSLNPRLPENKLVCTNRVSGEWQNAQTASKAPFTANVAFDLMLANTLEGIAYYVNGELLGTFAHRVANPARDYAILRIHSDVEIQNIEVADDTTTYTM